MFSRKGWIGVMSALLLFGGGTAHAGGNRICTAFKCDVIHKCTWIVAPTQLPKGESLDKDKQLGVNGALFKGYCLVGPQPIDLDGYAISAGPSLTLNKASTQVSQAKWEVRHIQTCPACTFTEGRGRSHATIAFKARAEIRDPLLSDAFAAVYASLKAEEPTTKCKVELKNAGLKVASAGSTTAGVATGPNGGGSLGGTKYQGNASELERLFHDTDETTDVEANIYYVTMEAALDQATLSVDGWSFGMAQALVEIVPSQYELILELSCDNCKQPLSKMNERFPQ